MLIEPKKYQGKTNSKGKLIGKHPCEICNDNNAKMRRRIDPTKDRSENNLVYSCRQCHTSLMRMFEQTSKEGKLYNGIQPIDLLNELKTRKFKPNDEIEIDEPSPENVEQVDENWQSKWDSEE